MFTAARTKIHGGNGRRGCGGDPEKIPRKKSKAQDPVHSS